MSIFILEATRRHKTVKFGEHFRSNFYFPSLFYFPCIWIPPRTIYSNIKPRQYKYNAFVVRPTILEKYIMRWSTLF